MKPRRSLEEYLSVSDLVTLLNRTLESALPRVLFEGEISQITRAQSGHLYFTVKDKDAQISAVMWRSSVRSLSFEPDAGDAVQCIGRPNLYPKSGRFQIVVHTMLPAGEGALRKKFLALKQKLEAEGLFEEARKRPLPFLPKAIGLVTSKTGAAIHDIMVKIRERMPQVQVYLCDARVQGDEAVGDIVHAIERFNRSGIVDVIIIGRGGGSLEDLWAFNEEDVVRAVFASKIPIISGVGHEVDVALSDLAADARAPTPTAAAEMVVPIRSELLRAVDALEVRLRDVERWIAPKGQAVDEAAFRLEKGLSAVVGRATLALSRLELRVREIEPRDVLAGVRSKLELRAQALHAAVRKTVERKHRMLDNADGRLRRISPRNQVAVMSRRLDSSSRALDRAAAAHFRQLRHTLEASVNRYHAVHPQRVLQRGFSVVRGEQGIVKDAHMISVGERVELTFSKGSAVASVETKRESLDDS